MTPLHGLLTIMWTDAVADKSMLLQCVAKVRAHGPRPAPFREGWEAEGFRLRDAWARHHHFRLRLWCENRDHVDRIGTAVRQTLPSPRHAACGWRALAGQSLPCKLHRNGQKDGDGGIWKSSRAVESWVFFKYFNFLKVQFFKKLKDLNIIYILVN